MSTRRSARVVKPVVQGPDEASSPEPAPKVKAPATKKAKISASKGKATKSNATMNSIATSTGLGKDRLSSMPPEILKMILDNIKAPVTMAALGGTCKALYSLMMPRLYSRVSVAAMFHAHIPKLIRTLEPHLTIKQKKQLKKEGKYKGQQERYPTGLDETARPICATYVRQVIIGRIDPGKKHKYMPERYVDEALKNMPNVEIVELYELTKNSAQRLASMKQLKALSIASRSSDLTLAEITKPLADVKNLRHLVLNEHEVYSLEDFGGLSLMLLNSMSTLESLDFSTSDYFEDFWPDLEKLALKSKTHAFTALQSLSLAGISYEKTPSVNSLHKLIDFRKLKELNIKHVEHASIGPFFKRLTESIAGAGEIPAGVNLHTLNLKMSCYHWNATPESTRLELEVKCRFISSFNTLSTLVLSDYGSYKDTIMVNPGLSPLLLEAILKHKNLKTLRICYAGQAGGEKIPYLSAATIKSIINGLPLLEDFEFAPEEAEIMAIGEALTSGTNLRRVTCFPHDSWGRISERETLGHNIVTGIVKPLLDKVSSDPAAEFVWEDHCKLRQVSLSYQTWDIASKFAKGKRGVAKPLTVESTDAKHQVQFRQTPYIQHIHVGYDPEFTWVDKIDRELAKQR